MPFVGTPDLEPETSVNYEVAAYFDNHSGLSANVTFFHNEFKDKIARADAIPNCYDSNDNRVFDEGCVDVGPGRSEERRVGKECGARRTTGGEEQTHTIL